MELTNVYESFILNQKSPVAMVLQQEYGINLLRLKPNLSFMPTYLEEVNHNWRAYLVEDVDIQFYFIIDETDQLLVELEMMSLHTKHVA